jgi:hypothetical protein
MPDLPPEVKSQAVSFLFDIGRWAASYLKERWKLAHQKKGAKKSTEVDLSKPKEDVDKISEELLRDIVAEHGSAKVERVLKLIERKRKLILDWQERKVDNEEEYNLQRIALATLRARQQELDQKIARTLVEIEDDLKELGVKVEKDGTA